MKLRKKYSSIAIVGGLIMIALLLAVVGPVLVKNNTVPSEGGKLSAKGVTSKGIVESEGEYELSSQVSGVIQDIKVKKGDEVRAGQELVVFDSGKARAKLRMAEAMLRESEGKSYRSEAAREQAKLEYERQKRLYDREATTLGELERAEERFRAAEGDVWDMRSRPAEGHEKSLPRTATIERHAAEVAYYQALLKDYVITSPVDGVVIERLKDRRESVDAGTPVLTVLDPKQLRVRAEIEETDVGKVIVGQHAEVWTDAYPDRKYNGQVVRVLPAVKRKQQRTFDPASSFDINTQEVQVRLTDYSGLQNGMSVTMKFGARPDAAQQKP
ncbi:MAG: HlyD family secretion protein [Nitrospirae bacterium]|nr:MAG: HlyD family secretion protein [Nitrospirota bacterium]